MTQTPILILAGGASRRMGARDKLLEPVNGVPLLRVMAERARAASDEVLVLVRPERPARLEALLGVPVSVHIAAEALEGIGGSLRAGSGLLADRDAFLLILADMPEITAQDMQNVMAARIHTPDRLVWRGATCTGQPGHPILFAKEAYGVLSGLSGDCGAQVALRRMEQAGQVHLVSLPDNHARLDLDTSEDWDAWRRSHNRSDLD